MATRVCPQCGSQYVASVRRCIDCDIVLIDEVADDAEVAAPAASTSTPVNDGDEVAYELEGWSNQLKLSLEGMLSKAEIRHVWEAAVLVVPAESEEQVDALIATVEGVEADELDDEGPQVAFDLAELSAEELDELDARLYADGVVHAWTEELELLVPEEAAEAVEAVIDSIINPPEDVDLLAAAGGIVLQDRLSALYVAVDKLVKDPLGAKQVARFLGASEGLEELGVPYGLSGDEWTGLLDTVADLRRVVQSDPTDPLVDVDAEHAPRDEDGEELDEEELEEMAEAVDRSGDEDEAPVVDRHGLARDLALELRSRLRDLV